MRRCTRIVRACVTQDALGQWCRGPGTARSTVGHGNCHATSVCFQQRYSSSWTRQIRKQLCIYREYTQRCVYSLVGPFQAAVFKPMNT